MMSEPGHFNGSKDQYSRGACDFILYEAIRAIQGILRPGGLVTRYGGGKLLLLMNGAGVAGEAAPSDKLPIAPQH